MNARMQSLTNVFGRDSQNGRRVYNASHLMSKQILGPAHYKALTYRDFPYHCL